MSSSGVPTVLLSQSEPLWDDVSASRAWFRSHRLKPGRLFDVGPASRRREAIEAWAAANGGMRDDLPKLVDHHKLRAFGIEPYGADSAAERLAAASSS